MSKKKFTIFIGAYLFNVSLHVGKMIYNLEFNSSGFNAVCGWICCMILTYYIYKKQI